MRARCRNFVMFCLGTLVLAVAGSTGLTAAESWLTADELQLFAALGLDAKVEGKAIQREAKYGSLTEIGNRAPEPLKGRILAMAEAYPHLSLSPAEKQEFEALTLKAAEQMQGELRKATVGALLDEDSWKRAAEATNAMLEKEGPVRDAWRMQTKWYIREVDAREVLNKNMSLITADLEQRSGRTRPESDLALTLASEGKTLSISGKVGAAPLTSAVVQVSIHKANAGGALSALNLASTAWLQKMGVSNMSLLPLSPGAVEGAALTRAQEKSFDMPIVKTYGLPKLAPGSRLSIDVDEDLNDVIFFERVSLKAWTAEGTITLDNIEGLAAVQKYREEVPRDQRFKTPPGGEERTNPPAKTALPARSAKNTEREPTGRSAFGARNPDPTTPSEGEPNKRSAFGGNPDPQRKLTAQERRAQAQRQAVIEQQAQSALELARTALAKKQNEIARVHLNQVIALAPDSRAASQANSLLKKLDK